MLLGDRVRWDRVEVSTSPAPAILVSVIREDRVTLLGRGDPGAAEQLVRERVTRRAEAGQSAVVGWMSLPRGADVDHAVLGALGLAPYSSWDWLVIEEEPAPLEAERSVVRLDRHEQADAIRACLAEANPGTTADPTGPDEAAWFGVPEDDGLAGVFGASLRGGRGDAGWSWHLHGLGVRPRARGRGIGAALTAAVTRAGLRSGAGWVSLGMYADNDTARRIYHRLGFVTDAEFTSWGPVGARRPPT